MSNYDNINFSYDGEITSDDGEVLSTSAFAGNNYRADTNPTHIPGRNNASMQAVHFIGPLPIGTYEIGKWDHYPKVGANAAPLTYIEGSGPSSYGRSGFFIHGPGENDPLNSSEGCICVPHDDRLKIMSLNPQTVTVTA